MRCLFALVGVSLLVAACGAGDSSTTAASSVPGAPTTTVTLPAGDQVVLLSGSVRIPAAQSLGDPGFHEVFVLTGTLPDDAAGTTGELVVRLWDADRPDLTCDADHPQNIAGCATIDWSDFEDRPAVPVGGVFDNHLKLISSNGEQQLFLSEERGLADTPDEYVPT